MNQPEGGCPEVSPAAAGLLRLVNSGTEQMLRSAPGLPAEVVARIMTYRASGAKFKNLVQLEGVTKMTEKNMEDALRPFQDVEDAKATEALRKPVPEPRAPGKTGAAAAGTQKDGSTGKGPISAVRLGFYGKLPGYEDLDKIDPIKRTEFLETVNREMCTCGCQGETLAFCLVNDPLCPVVKAQVKKIYDDIMKKPR
jgi:hypothetical protein